MTTNPSEDEELRLAQLVCSRLCHDLVSPSGAVNAGLEMLAEAPDPIRADDDALSLVQRSAGELNDRLAFFRMAFGLGGGPHAMMALAPVRDLVERAYVGPRVSMTWDGADIKGREVSGAAIKLIMMALLIAFDSLPRGGSVTVTLADVDGGLGVAITAQGQGAKLRDGIQDALDLKGNSLDGVTARSVHAALAARLSAGYNLPFEVDEAEPDFVRLALIATS